MIGSDGQKIFVILHVVDAGKVLREAPKQAHFRLKNISWMRST